MLPDIVTIFTQGLLRLLWGGPEVGVLRDCRYLCSKSNLRPLIILQKKEAILSRQEKYIEFSTLESMPYRISNQMNTFISFALVSYHFRTRNRGDRASLFSF